MLFKHGKQTSRKLVTLVLCYLLTGENVAVRCVRIAFHRHIVDMMTSRLRRLERLVLSLGKKCYDPVMISEQKNADL